MSGVQTCALPICLGRAALIDVGAAGKGLLADQMGAWLEREGVEEYLVDASGDLLVRCAEPLRLGLEEPGSTEEDPRVVGVVELARGALCASGTALLVVRVSLVWHQSLGDDHLDTSVREGDDLAASGCEGTTWGDGLPYYSYTITCIFII